MQQILTIHISSTSLGQTKRAKFKGDEQDLGKWRHTLKLKKILHPNKRIKPMIQAGNRQFVSI
jgi:hypothetical protein